MQYLITTLALEISLGFGFFLRLARVALTLETMSATSSPTRRPMSSASGPGADRGGPCPKLAAAVAGVAVA